MSKLLTVLGFSANDAIAAERLLDYIALLNKKEPRGACLLVAAPDTHAETQTKMRIAAEVAFASVELLAVGWPAIAPTTKAEAVNRLWSEGMTHATRCYQRAALWLEPDCVPLLPSWLDNLTEAYDLQPKRYLGSIMASADGKMKCLNRVAIYPRGSAGELKEFCAGKTPFELAAGNIVVPRAGKTKLIQQLRFDATTDMSSVRSDAVLLHGDKESVLLSVLMDQAIEPHPCSTFVPPINDPEPTDKRTRAWKEWSARHQPVTA